MRRAFVNHAEITLIQSYCGKVQNRIDAAHAADALLGAVGQIRRRSRRAVGGPLPETSLTGSQTELVRLVRREPGIGVADAAARLGLAPNTVSTLVRQLVEAGHMRREPDPDDRRAARLRLTDRARREVEQWRDRRIEAVARALDRLDAADLDALDAAITLLSRVGELIEPDEAREEAAG